VVHGHVTGCVNVIRDGTLPRDENEMTCNFAVVKVSGRCGRRARVCVCGEEQKTEEAWALLLRNGVPASGNVSTSLGH
jgi:hypothetical protein